MASPTWAQEEPGFPSKHVSASSCCHMPPPSNSAAALQGGQAQGLQLTMRPTGSTRIRKQRGLALGPKEWFPRSCLASLFRARPRFFGRFKGPGSAECVCREEPPRPQEYEIRRAALRGVLRRIRRRSGGFGAGDTLASRSPCSDGVTSLEVIHRWHPEPLRTRPAPGQRCNSEPLGRCWVGRTLLDP